MNALTDKDFLLWFFRTAGTSKPSLDLIMPNGKRLGDCTAAECQELGERLEAIGQLWVGQGKH
jgi:hypothetical protein